MFQLITFQVIKEVVGALFGPKLIEWVDGNMGAWDKKLPEPYATEIASKYSIDHTFAAIVNQRQ